MKTGLGRNPWPVFALRECPALRSVDGDVRVLDGDGDAVFRDVRVRGVGDVLAGRKLEERDRAEICAEERVLVDRVHGRSVGLGEHDHLPEEDGLLGLRRRGAAGELGEKEHERDGAEEPVEAETLIHSDTLRNLVDGRDIRISIIERTTIA